MFISPSEVLLPLLIVFFKGIRKAPIPLDIGFLSFSLRALLTCGFTPVFNGSGVGKGGAGGGGAGFAGGNFIGSGGYCSCSLNKHIRFHHP